MNSAEQLPKLVGALVGAIVWLSGMLGFVVLHVLPLATPPLVRVLWTGLLAACSLGVGWFVVVLVRIRYTVVFPKGYAILAPTQFESQPRILRWSKDPTRLWRDHYLVSHENVVVVDDVPRIEVRRAMWNDYLPVLVSVVTGHTAYSLYHRARWQPTEPLQVTIGKVLAELDQGSLLTIGEVAKAVQGKLYDVLPPGTTASTTTYCNIPHARPHQDW